MTAHTANTFPWFKAALAVGMLVLAVVKTAGYRAIAEDAPAADIVLADFEGDTYGDWKTEGAAFGAGPARGTLPNQMDVSGFAGKGLVNSYRDGDNTEGKLISPEFTIERKFINFMVGGGAHPFKACINLVVDGNVVHTTTGQDSEHLDWETWDVAKLAGKKARIEIVDSIQGGWGHINVDQISQSNTRKAEVVGPQVLYQEKLRPQFHFTAAKNWLNDPNGLVFYQGEYHLFFQHNPTGINWGNMTWGHAVSPDLVHWKQLDNAIDPDKLGTIYSGSAVIDWNNAGGWQKGDEKTLVCMYTSAGKPFTQSIAYSNDRGRTFTKIGENPVLKHIAGENRDPKVFWHEPSKKWVMALYLDGDRYALYGSKDLKDWKELCKIPSFGASECPDMFELAVEGTANEKKWVFWGGNNTYLLGSFDGEKFEKESGPFKFEYGANYYAAQSYSDIPTADGRRIQIAWMNGGRYPKMPFNQQMSFPSVLTLRKLDDGLRVCRMPVAELEKLHGEKHSWKGELGRDNPLAAIKGSTFDIQTEIEPGLAKEIRFTLRGAPVVYNVERKELSLMDRKAPVPLVDGKLRLRFLVDRTSIEVFAHEGRVSLSSCYLPNGDVPLSIAGDGAKVLSLDVYDVKSSLPE